MEQTIASTRAISPSSIWPAAWRISLDMPGMSFISPPSEPIFFTWRSWDRKSSSVKWPCMRRAAPLATVVVVHGALGLLDEAEHVAHAEDAVGHAVGVEEVEVGQPLARAGEGDRLADDPLDGEGGAAAGVAVELGEDDGVEREGLVEGLGGRHRVLADHGVDDQERVVRLGGRRDAPDLVHEVGVDGEPPGGVDDADVLAQAPGLLDAGPGHGHGIGGLAEDGDAGLGAEDPAAARPRPAAAGRRPTRSGLRPCCFHHRASLAEAVVLPEPWRPAISTTVGGREA